MVIGRHKFYEDDNFVVEFAIYERIAYLHCRVYNWNHKVLRKLYMVSGELLNFLAKECDEAITVTPNPKFAELMGGRFVKTVIAYDNEYEVYKWDLILLQSD